MKPKTIEIESLCFLDREEAEDWFLLHTCEAAYPDMTITEDRSSGIGVAIIASCTCGSEHDITDYAS